MDEPKVTPIVIVTQVPAQPAPITQAPEKAAPLQLIQDFTDKLTLRRLATALIAGVLALGMFTVYEKREEVFNAVFERVTATAEDPKTWEVSETTKAEMVALSKNSLIKLVIVTQVDLQKNLKMRKFLTLNDPAAPMLESRLKDLLPQPLFNDDNKNTQQMVAVLNNQFVCNPYSDTVLYKVYPTLDANIPVVCRIAVPPFYGRFVGILTFGLSRTPSSAELDQLRIEASRLSVEIYLRDVIKRRV